MKRKEIENAIERIQIDLHNRKLEIDQLSTELFRNTDYSTIFTTGKDVVISNLKVCMSNLDNSIKYIDYIRLGGACYEKDVPCEIEFINKNGESKITSSCNPDLSVKEQLSENEPIPTKKEIIQDYRQRVDQIEDKNSKSDNLIM